MSISSPRINAMLSAVHSASKCVMRDFYELQISGIRSPDFINKVYLKSQRTIYDNLYDERRNYRFIYENEDADQELKDSDYTWFVIPIEGKKNFNSCIVYFAVSVCLIHRGKAVAVVVGVPSLGETFWAEEKNGAIFENARLRNMRMRVQMRESGLVDVSGSLLNKLPLNVSCFNSEVLGFAYLASGRYNGVVYSKVNKYKVLIGELFMRESRGKLLEEGEFIVAGSHQFVQNWSSK